MKTISKIVNASSTNYSLVDILPTETRAIRIQRLQVLNHGTATAIQLASKGDGLTQSAISAYLPVAANGSIDISDISSSEGSFGCYVGQSLVANTFAGGSLTALISYKFGI